MPQPQAERVLDCARARQGLERGSEIALRYEVKDAAELERKRHVTAQVGPHCGVAARERGEESAKART